MIDGLMDGKTGMKLDIKECHACQWRGWTTHTFCPACGYAGALYQGEISPTAPSLHQTATQSGHIPHEDAKAGD